jgi:hypothetical protein
MNADIIWKPLNWRPLTYDDLVVGWEHQWDVPITFPVVAWYADLAQDPHEWYTQRGSPFGPPVVPPLVISRLGSELTSPLGRMMGFLNTRNRTETLAPAVVGMVVRFKGRIAEKFEQKGRRYVRMVIEARDAATGQLLTRDMKEYTAPEQKA